MYTCNSEFVSRMRRLALKLAIFITPFVLYALAVVAIDPFDYFRLSSIYDHKRKMQVSNSVYERLSKLCEYKHIRWPTSSSATPGRIRSIRC